MHYTLNFKSIITSASLMLFISCNSNSKDKVKVQEITLQDIKQEEKKIEPPPPPPPRPEPQKIEVKDALKKCFANNGLKYETVIILGIGKTDIIGSVTSKELETGKKEFVLFTGTISGNGMIMKFKGTPPDIGAASEWTDKPWTLKKVGEKETLHIIFNAKDYNTNKWAVTDYQFVQVDCK